LTLLLAPLNELLSEKPYETPNYVQQQVELAARNGQRLLCLADVLQDFSSIETARMTARYEAVDLSAFTAGIASMFKSIAKNIGVELIVDCPPLPQPVWVDPDMWETIVLNLTSNAFKYTRAGKIEISLRARGSHAVLEVRDTGIGIPPEKMPKLFDRFNCANDSPGHLDDGSGMSLAVVHELAKLNRATVSASSTSGDGSLFTVAIPFGTTPMQSSASRARTRPKIADDTATSTRFAAETIGHLRATKASSTGRMETVPAQPPTTDAQLHPHILIVNDDADLRRYIRSLLSPLYAVSEAESDEQALELLQREIPDLILADTTEPGRDGAQLLREVRSSVRTAAVPVITLAARSNEDARIDALYAGADDYLTKPFSARDLLARIDAQLSTSRLRSEILRRERVLRAEAEKLNEVALWLNAELDLYTLLQKVTDTATDLTGARIGAFFDNRVDSSSGSYELVTLCGLPRAAFETLGVPRNTPLLRQTFRDGKVVRLDDIRTDPRYGKNQSHGGMSEEHPPLCSYLAVPVISRSGEILGGLFFGHPQPGIFTDRAERLVRGIAAQAAVAIDNARLYGRAQREIDERKRAETALRQSEERYRDLIRDLPAAVYACANDGTLTLFNEASVELWGQVPIVGRSAWSGSTRMFTPDGRPIPPDRCPLALTLRDGLPRGPIEILIERPDTSRRSVIAHPRPLRDSSGAVTGAINMLVDITDRKLAEAQLAAAKDDLALQVKALTRLHQLAMEPVSTRNMEPSLRVALETAVELHGADFGQILLYDRSAGVLRTASSIGFTTPMPERMACFTPGPGTGASGDAFVSQRRAVVFDTENDSRFASIREIARAVGLRSVHSTPIVARSDGIVGVLAVYFKKTRIPTFREVQLIDLCASHAANIVETAATQQALRESQRLYHAIGESIDYGVWTCDPQGRNTYVSPSFLRLVGMTQEECSGFGWTNALHPDQAAGTLKAWQECIKSGDSWDRQLRLRDVHGRYHTVLARGVPVKNDRGEIVAWSGINLDISRLKAVEKNLRNANQRKNEFLATLAHELRNPLAPLLNGLELIKRGSANPQVIEKARQMMERQLRHMVRLIDDLLDLSRITEGKIELRKERIDLSLALQNAIQTCRPLIEQREQILTVDIPASPLIVDADMTRLEQIFANLLNNAAKYTHEGGTIHLHATRGNDKVIVSLRDDGIGIPPEMLERIFDMFVQVDRSLEKIHSGLGIGLTLVKRLVRMHGGTVEAHSAGPGHGSEFIVKLPAALPEAAVSTHARAAVPDGSTESAQRRRVLVVDDNPDCANSLAMMLELSGAEVRVASDGLDAVEAAAAFSPDLVLMDICMPRMNGYDACRHMRQQAWSKNSIIVALTGRGQADDVRRSHEVGFNGHLVKPVPPEAIGQLMSTLNPAPPTENST
jgi:PAS domain S-box-containing protein